MTRSYPAKVYLAIQGILGRETEKAIQIQLHAPTHSQHGKSTWFPLSQVVSIHRCYDVDAGTFDVLMCSEWILGEKGLLSASSSTNPATASPTKDKCVPIPAHTEGVIPARTPAAIRKEKALRNYRAPYKDDEGPVDEDEIPF